jgi:hypothetical protein
LLLEGKTQKVNNSLLRNDVLSNLLGSAGKNNYAALYLNSVSIRNVLVEQYNEIRDPAKPRKTFSPGLFKGYQGKLNCAIITRYVIENEFRWGFSTAVHKLNYKMLYSHHLRSVKECFENLYELLKAAYPERELKPYYFKKYRNVWHDEQGNLKAELVREAIREFVSILTRQGYKFRSMPKWINYKLFQKKILPYNSNLSYMLSKCFKNSPADAIIFAFPELNLKPHYFHHVPKGYWKGARGKENAKIIMQELYDRLTDKKGAYRFTNSEFLSLVKYTTYQRPIMPYGKKLGGMLQSLFNNSPSEPLQLIGISCDQLCEKCTREGKECCMIMQQTTISNF